MLSTVRRFARTALLLPLLAAAAGCDIAMADLKARETAEWRRTYTLQPGGRVQVGNVNGRIVVEPSAGQTVEIVAEKTARAATPEAAKAALERIEIVEDAGPASVRIETRHPRQGGGFGGVQAEVSYSVKVPAGADVRFSTVNGGIEASRLTGQAEFEAVNGGITARDLAGAVTATTVNGGVTIDLAHLTGAVKLSSTNGGIRLSVPADARADFSAQVVNGGIEVDGLALESSVQSRRRIEGRLNGGGARISIEGTNGGVRVTAR